MAQQPNSSSAKDSDVDLLHSEHYWIEALLETLPDMVIFKSGQGAWLLANDFTLSLFNLQDVDYQGKTDAELASFSETHRAAFTACSQTDEQAWRQARLCIEEEHIPSQDGTHLRIFETYKVPLFYDDGSRKGLVVIGRDITQRRRSETQNRRLGRILEGSYNEIYVIDSKTLRFVQVNRGARLNLGYSAEELEPLTLLDIAAELPTKEEFERRVAPLVDGSQRQLTFESTHMRKNGSTYPVEVRLMLASAEVEPVFVAIAQDISERRRVEALKDEFLAIVSHELRTPLTPLLGVFEVLNSRSAQFDSQTNELIRLGLRNAQRLRQKIEQLLTFRTVSGDEASFRWAHHELNDIVRAAIDGSRYLEKRYDYCLETNYHDSQLWVRADRRYLEQSISVLFANAVKFSQPGGCIQVSVDPVEDNHAKILISDQGPGIDEQLREAIFEPFSQADSSVSRPYGGTGLGLPIARTIVEKLGGQLSFENREEQGAAFFITLPLVDS